jgi:hypothetical protein
MYVVAYLGLDGSDGVAHGHGVRSTLFEKADVQLQLGILRVKSENMGGHTLIINQLM